MRCYWLVFLQLVIPSRSHKSYVKSENMFNIRAVLLVALVACTFHFGQAANMIEKYLDKKYELQSSENFDNFMQALGIGFFTRKAASLASPVAYLKKLGDNEYVLKSESTFKNSDLTFTVGKEFEQETPDGRKLLSTITIDGATLKEVQREPDQDNRQTIIDRIFSDDQIVMEMKVVNKNGETHAKRIYKAI